MAKADHNTDRQSVERLTDIVNIGPAVAGALESIGVTKPQQLIGADGAALYEQLIESKREFYDPCVLDTFLAAVDYMNGNQPRAWWHYTADRKRRYTEDVDRLRKFPLAR